MRNQTTITAARCFLFGMLALVHVTAWAQGDAVAEHNFPADGCADGNDNGGDDAGSGS